MQFAPHPFALPIQSVEDRFFHPLLRGNVAGDGIDLPPEWRRPGRPLQPFPGAVAASVAVLEADRGGTLGEGVHLRERRCAIVGMHEVEERPRPELRRRPAQNLLPRRIHVLEHAVEPGDAKEVERLLEEVEQLLAARLSGFYLQLAFRMHAVLFPGRSATATLTSSLYFCILQ